PSQIYHPIPEHPPFSSISDGLRTIMPPSWVNPGNENVTEAEPKGGVGERCRPSPPRRGQGRRGVPRRISDNTNAAWPAKPAQLRPASSPAIEPLERRRFVSKTLDVDAVLAPYQFDVLMGDAQLLGVPKQSDLMRRIGGESPEVREKSRPLNRENRVRGMHTDQHARPL